MNWRDKVRNKRAEAEEHRQLAECQSNAETRNHNLHMAFHAELMALSIEHMHECREAIRAA